MEKYRYTIEINNSIGCKDINWKPLTHWPTYKAASEEFIRQYNNMELDPDSFYRIKKRDIAYSITK